VAGVWAVAATVIAVLAFLTASDNEGQQITNADRLSLSTQRRLSREVNQLQARVANAAPSSQVRSVGRQLRQLSRVASRQDRQLESVGTQLRQIRAQINSLEQAADQRGTDTTTTP
jgi:hypothetical protein